MKLPTKQGSRERSERRAFPKNFRNEFLFFQGIFFICPHHFLKKIFLKSSYRTKQKNQIIEKTKIQNFFYLIFL